MKKALVIVCVFIGIVACSKKETVQPFPDVAVTMGSMTDSRDAQLYKTIRIGEQEWLAENLRYRLPTGTLEGCFTYGEPSIRITEVEVDKPTFVAQVKQAVTNKEIVDPPGLPAMQRPTVIISLNINGKTPRQLMEQLTPYPDVVAVINRIYESLLGPAAIANAQRSLTRTEAENGNYAKRYGFLYTHEAAGKAVPAGWRLPTDADWKELESTLGIPQAELDNLDEWRGSIATRLVKGTADAVGFDAGMGGGRLYGTFMYGTPFMNVDVNGYYWTASSYAANDSTSYAITRNFMINQGGVMRGTAKKEAAYHVRCIKVK